MANERYQFQSLGPQHNRAGFSCGVAALDRYFQQQASQDQRHKLAAPYVLTDTVGGAILGYYTLSAYSIRPASLSEDFTRKLPRYDSLPATLIGRLAVEQGRQGEGLGRLLLVDALRRCLLASREVASVAVVVDAKDDRARAFYEHYGFLRFADHDYRLYLPMATITQLELEAIR